jgi:hypothetical protein
MPVELTAHSAGFAVVPGLGGCEPQLTGSVSRRQKDKDYHTMSDLKDLVDSINLPKTILEKADAFLRVLLGPATTEAGELLADRIRFRRFRNQVRMLQTAQDLLDAAGLKAKEVPLRTLVPLVERASLEEHPDLQRMWATLLANASQESIGTALQSVCIAVLSNISPLEAKILTVVYSDYLEKEPKFLEEWRAKGRNRSTMPASFLFYRPLDLLRRAAIPEGDGEILLDNLQRLGILRLDTPQLEDGEIQDPDYMQLTELGLRVLKTCNEPPAARSSG